MKRNTSPSLRKRRKRKSAPTTTYDSLEARLNLTVFVVNTLVDAVVEDGSVSLREAVMAANSNAPVGDAPAGEANGDLIWFDESLTDGTFNLVRGQLEVTDDVFIQGGDRNLTINGGGFDRLFGINSNERVGFSKLNFTTGRQSMGGAILAEGTGSTIIFDSVFADHEATGIGGGAIYNADGFMAIINSTFNNNEASSSNGNGGALQTSGGYVYVNGGGMFNNNADGNGGAIEIAGGTFYSVDLDVGAPSQGNAAGLSGNGNGGGLHVSGISFVTFSGGNVDNNFATGNGGGIATAFGSNVFVSNGAEVINNFSDGDNESSGGGGIYNEDTNLYVANSRIALNQATGNLSKGGGILSSGGIASSTNSVIENNAARDGGGGIAIIKGFGISNGNTVRNNDVGMTLTDGKGLGGGIYVETTDSADQSIFVMNGGLIQSNEAWVEGGGLWSGSDSLVFLRNFSNVISNRVRHPFMGGGGGVHTNGYVQMLDSFVQQNESRESGGGVWVDRNGFLRANNTNFNSNTAEENGGGLYVDGFAKVTASSFVSNAVQGEGGGVFVTTLGSIDEFNNQYSLNTPDDTNF